MQLYRLSFAGCGFLGVYHLGVASAMATRGTTFLRNVQKYTGASAGALVAAVLAVRGTDKTVIEESAQVFYSFVEDFQKKRFGLLTPNTDFLLPLRDYMSEVMPSNAHVIATNKLYVSMTTVEERRNVLVSEFRSRDHLIKCLLASCSIPYLTTTGSIDIFGKKYMDGGLSNNLPILPGGKTVTVSPFSGKQDICPADKLGRLVRISQQEFLANKINMVRGLHSLHPPKKQLQKYFIDGHRDGISFLEKCNYLDGEL